MSIYQRADARTQKTIRRILKVNHAGEYGAIRIYRAQLFVAKKLYPDLLAFLEETLGHEIQHCALFYSAMPMRETRPCRVMSLWGNGGYVLGLMTAMFGRQGIWICTSAVEATVHKHLEDQLTFLRGKDAELGALIGSIQVEELHHLDHAKSQITYDGWWARLMKWAIGVVTEILIFLSTWGDSVRMPREFRKQSEAG
jgi:3-demethoxyubiquinol 3-hydroxylase